MKNEIMSFKSEETVNISLERYHKLLSLVDELDDLKRRTVDPNALPVMIPISANPDWNSNMWMDLSEATRFFYQFQKYGELGNKIAIENTIPHKYAIESIGKYTQIIQPYQFGHLEKKATCLWLYGLPKLKETNNVYDEMMKLPYSERAKVHCCAPGPERAKLRSKTYAGIAEAMAEQWGILF